MPKLVIYPAIDPYRFARIQEAAPHVQVINCDGADRALREISSADAFYGKMTSEILAAAAKLRWVQSPTASLEHYMFPELIAHPCVLTNMRGLFNDVIADHVMAFVLAHARRLPQYFQRQSLHKWEPIGGEDSRLSYSVGPGQVSEMDRQHWHMAGKTLGVVGVGGIGSEVCRRAAAFGMQIVGIDPRVKRLEELHLDIGPVSQLRNLLQTSDVVVVACPQTPETVGMFGASEFHAMKRGSFFVNVGRGAIVQLAPLVDALQSGWLGGAGLDVFEIEPLPESHELWECPNLMITPHIAAASPEIAPRHTAVLIENVRRFFSAEELLNVVDKESWY